MTSLSGKPRLIQKVRLRRNGQPLREVSTRSLILEIRNGTLQSTDEFSGDGLHWIPLGNHHQLSRYFKSPEPASPMDQQLGQLAQMLDDINKG